MDFDPHWNFALLGTAVNLKRANLQSLPVNPISGSELIELERNTPELFYKCVSRTRSTGTSAFVPGDHLFCHLKSGDTGGFLIASLFI